MVKVEIGACPKCSRRFAVSGKNLRRHMRYVCSCGQVNDIVFDDESVAILRGEAQEMQVRYPDRDMTIARIA